MKLLTGLFCLLSLCVLVCANRDWRIHTVPQGEQVMPISIALTNNNLDWLQQTLAEVSNPRHPNWRKYVTQEELKEKTAPSASIVDFVGKYLEKNGATSLELYASGDFITANFKVRDLERMLNVKIRQYVHKITGEKILRATSHYTLPKDLVGLVDVIGMVSEFPASHLRTRTSGKDFRNRPQQQQQQQALKESQPEEGVSSCVANPLSFGYPASSDTDLYSQVTINCCNGNGTRNVTAPCFDVDYPNVLQSFNVHVYSNVTGAYVYSAQVPYNPSVCSYDAGVGSVTCSLVFTPFAQLEPYGNYNIAVFANYTTLVSNMQFFPTALVTSPFVTPQVLAQAYGIYEPTRNTSLATSQSVVEFGGQYYSPTDLANFFGNMSLPQRTAVLVGPNDPSVPGDEATLDIEWIMAVSQVSETTFWSIKTGYLLEWTAQLLASNSPPLVNSVSYAGNEVDSPAVYRDRVDLQFQKLGAVGVSIVVASGDAGATDVGHGSDACNPFQPQYPSSSPFVTTVSATFFTPKSDPICWGNYYGKQVHCGGQIGEISVTANLGMDWTTGGGFSNHVPQQSWQSTAVNNYLQHSGAVLPPSSMFNASGRAYPDVSANGHNLVLINNGVMDIGDGTSASTPIFTGFLALINNYLATIGENPVGFATPLLYEIQANYPSAFYDVTYGNNYCGDVLHPPYIACCEYGYNCAVGWDPVTGLGTPRLSGLLSAVQDLVSQQKSKQ